MRGMHFGRLSGQVPPLHTPLSRRRGPPGTRARTRSETGRDEGQPVPWAAPGRAVGIAVCPHIRLNRGSDQAQLSAGPRPAGPLPPRGALRATRPGSLVLHSKKTVTLDLRASRWRRGQRVRGCSGRNGATQVRAARGGSPMRRRGEARGRRERRSPIDRRAPRVPSFPRAIAIVRGYWRGGVSGWPCLPLDPVEAAAAPDDDAHGYLRARLSIPLLRKAASEVRANLKSNFRFAWTSTQGTDSRGGPEDPGHAPGF